MTDGTESISFSSKDVPETAATEAPVQPPKRKRSRSRKNPLPEPKVQAAEVASTPKAQVSEVVELPKPPKRRPGRPRKSEVLARQAAEAAAVAAKLGVYDVLPAPSTPVVEKPADPVATAESASAAVPVEPPKRRRGRPRKNEVTPVQTTIDSELVSDKVPANEVEIGEKEAPTQASVDSERPAVRRRRRIIKSKEKTRAETTSETSSSDENKTNTSDSADLTDSFELKHTEKSSQRTRKIIETSEKSRTQNTPHQSTFASKRSKRGGDALAVEPTLSLEELSELRVAELRQRALEMNIDPLGIRKSDLIALIYETAAKKEGFTTITGILEISPEGFGFLRTNNYIQGPHDAFVFQQVIKQYGLRAGDEVVANVVPPRSQNQLSPVQSVVSINGVPFEEVGKRPHFKSLTPIYPTERLVMEHGKDSITGRAIDIVAPIGKGQRGLIVSPPKAGKTTILKKICESISANNPEVHLICLLVDERPEEVTDMERSIKGEVVSSTFDMPAENHTKVSELVIERAKRLVEMGRDVVVILDSITRLARAYNIALPASGRILSGGVDSAALYPPKRFLGAARNIEGGGSLTILASALIETGSKMDEVIFEEFKGTGNMELKLDRELADKRIYPAIDPVASGTRNEDLLVDEVSRQFMWGLRRTLANINNVERAETMLLRGLKSTPDNRDFLLRTAKKAQLNSEYSDLNTTND